MHQDDPKPRRKWVSVLLGVSLALNLLVLGLVAGAALRFHGRGDRPPPSFGPALYRALPDADRKDLREQMHLAGPGDRQSRQEGFRVLTAALRTVPFDANALTAIVEEQTALRVLAQQTLSDAWLDVVAKMTDAERSSYADRLDKYVRHGKGRHRRRD